MDAKISTKGNAKKNWLNVSNKPLNILLNILFGLFSFGGMFAAIGFLFAILAGMSRDPGEGTLLRLSGCLALSVLTSGGSFWAIAKVNHNVREVINW